MPRSFSGNILRMNKYRLFVGCAFIFLCGVDVSAYEVSTHQVLTRQAAERSVLKTTSGASLLSDLGLGDWDAVNYTPSTGGNRRAILDIMDFGAVYEDGDDQHQKRVYNHFFDTQYNNFTGRGLSLTPLVQGLMSPDWALEDSADVIAPSGDTQ